MLSSRSKGLELVVSSIFIALIAIGIIGLLYWLFLSHILDIHVIMDESTVERHSINLANVLISSEKLAYTSDDKIERGVLDVEKLDNLFVRKSDFLSNVKYHAIPKDIGIGYPNSLAIVEVLDLEKCDSSGNCEGWIVMLKGPVTITGLKVVDFTQCLAENINLDIGSIFRWFFGFLRGGVSTGIRYALWQPWDVEKCVKNTIPASVKGIFTKNPMGFKGFPVLIRYRDGSVHVGRLIVGVSEWF